jgi:ferric enterobactin receptor
MPAKPIIRIIFLLNLILLGLVVQAQQIKVTCDFENKPLNLVLNDVSKTTKIRFAYDNDKFSKIQVTVRANNMPLDQFLTLLAKKYGIGYRLIGSSYAMFYDEKLKEKPVAPVVKVPVKPKAPVLPTVIHVVEDEKVEISKPFWIGGYVRDLNSREPLRYCAVSIDSTKVYTTNDLGYVSFEVLNIKSIRISINHLGYEKFDSLFDVASSKSFDIGLQPFSLLLSTITVTPLTKSTVEYTEFPELIAFSSQAALYTPGIDASDMAKSLTLVPGISFLGGSLPGLSVRGSAPTENMVLLDGIPILETSHLYGNLSVLNSKYIHQAFVSRGGFGADMGGRVAGVIDMTGKTGGGDAPTVDVSLNPIHLNGYFGVPLTSKLAVSFAFRRSMLEYWNNYLAEKLLTGTLSFQPDQDFEESVDRPDVKFLDMNGKVTFSPQKGQEWTLSFMNGTDDQSRNYAFESGSRMYRSEMHVGRNGGMALGWNMQKSKHWMHKFSTGLNLLSNNWELNAGQLPNKNGKGGKISTELDNNDLNEMRIDFQSAYKTSFWLHQFGGGFTHNSLLYQFNSFSSTGNRTTDSLFFNRSLNVVHVFNQHQISVLNDRLKVRGGLRLHVQPETAIADIQPRFSLTYSPVKDFDVYYLGGRYVQHVSRIARIDAEGAVTPVWYIPTNDQFGKLSSIHHILGAKLPKGAFTFNVEAYQKTVDGKAALVGKSVRVNKERYISYSLVDGHEIHRGIDLYGQFRHGLFNHTLAYSLSESNEQFDGLNGGNWFASSTDQRHRIKFTELYTLNGWVAAFNWSFATGAPARIQSDDSGLMDSARLPNYSQVDVSLTKQIVARRFTFEGGISLLNVLNRNNVLGVDYFRLTGSDTDLSVKSEITALSFTPVAFVSIRFN